MQAAVLNGFFFGLILSLFMSALILLTLWINPTIWAERAPEDIRQAVGPVDERTRRLKRVFVLITLLGLISIVLLSLFRLYSLQGELTFWSVFLNLFILVTVWNLVDLILIDWLLLCVIQPKFMIMPGTEGLKGYSDFSYHFRGFLKGLLGSVISCLLIAGITMLVVILVQ